MKFDFDKVILRRGSGSIKWDSSDDPKSLPMWIADMDFPAPPAIIEALDQRVRHGIFGYTKIPAAYFTALRNWFYRRHGFNIDPDWVIPVPGVVPAISAILRTLTQPGDGVIIQPPVYNCFFSSIRNLQCKALENRLINNNGRYEMDFGDLERKAAVPAARVMLLCNPHNPVGRCWTPEELQRIGEICMRNNVTVVSDEIHCDLVFPGYQHQPFATLGPDFLANSVTCCSPSKSFNIAGLQIANIVVADPEKRKQVDKGVNVHEVCDLNPFGVEALIAGYNSSEEWLECLKDYLLGNYRTVAAFLKSNLPELKLIEQEATYLAWVDCRQLGFTSSEIAGILESEAHLLVSRGSLFGEAGEGFIRLNMACPNSVLLMGLNRMKDALIKLRHDPQQSARENSPALSVTS